jgi:radical SAM methylthiotransferase, MiaB/RimO family
VTDILTAPFEKMAVKHSSKTRAYVKIEDGCESRCAYCIIPAARGKVRSKHPDDVTAEVKFLAENGCKEVVLTGIETASYGRDFTNNYKLADLLEAIDKIDGIERIRLGSLDPSVMNESFANRIAALDKIMPHFHLSMQSGSTRILNLMRRKYTAQTALENMNRLREKIADITFTTDIMTGFPGETNEDFAETMDFCRNARFLNIHIFTYSKRKGTEAEKMPDQVDEQTKRTRSAQLAEQTKAIRKSIIEDYISNNETMEVLFEQTENSIATGHTRNFIEVEAAATENLSGKIKLVTNLSTDGNQIKATLK